MALAEIAHLLDRRRRAQTEGQGVQGTAERVMVCLSSRSPNSEPLLRKAARLADRLGAPWYAVYVQTPNEELHRVEAAVQRRISNTLALATQLGATTLPYKGADVVSTIAAFAASTASPRSWSAAPCSRGTSAGSAPPSSTAWCSPWKGRT